MFRRRQQEPHRGDEVDPSWASLLAMVKKLEQDQVPLMHEFGEMMALAVSSDPTRTAEQLGIPLTAADVASRSPSATESAAAKVLGLVGGYLTSERQLDPSGGAEYATYAGLLAARFSEFMTVRHS